MLSQAVVAALAIFAGVIDAAPQRGNGGPWGLSGGSSSNLRCYTVLGKTLLRGGPKTTYSTTTLPCTSTQTATVTSISSPLPSTSTITSSSVFTTTAPTSMLTSTTFTTLSFTVTTDTTVTSTATSTASTSSVVTSTVPAPSGFLPIQSSLPGVTYDGRGGVSPIGKRDPKVPVDRKLSYKNSIHDINQPQSVRCTVSQTAAKCTSIVSTVTSTSIASTPTQTITTTSISTSTIVPSATTTITSTFSTTFTTTNTVTTTTTSTTTSTSISTTSMYAACATNNFGTHYLGTQIYSTSYTGNIEFGMEMSTGVSSAYACCASTMESTFGNFWYYLASSGSCIRVTSATCPNPATSWTAVVYNSGDENIVWGNSMCGRVASADVW